MTIIRNNTPVNVHLFDVCFTGLLEYLIFPATSQGEDESYQWNRNTTLIFLNLYKEYRKQVGTLKIKKLKRMYEEIAKEVRYKTKHNVTAANCENRWKHLERAYKKFIDNNKKTGRGRKDFEYAEIMEEILGKKRNINPVVVLSSDTISSLPEKENIAAISPQIEQNDPENDTVEQCLEERQEKTPTIQTPKRNYRTRKLKADMLKEIRNDRREYYKKHLELEEKKLEEKRKHNKILEERNELLKQYVEKQLILPAQFEDV